MEHRFKTLAAIIGLACFPAVACAADLTLTFDVCMNWRYDLAKNDFDYSFTRPCFQVEASVADTKTGSVFDEASGTTNIQFGDTRVDSPLWMYVDFGFDVTSATPDSGVTTVQDTFIHEFNQGTWTFIGQGFNGESVALYRSLQYTEDPRLPNPAQFGSEELLALLQSHIGKAYGYREDSIFSGGGFQHNGTAILMQVVLWQDGSPDTLMRQLLKDVAGVGPGTSLADKITLAQTYYAVPDIQATCAMLSAFGNEVRAQRGKKIAVEVADELIEDAQALMSAIGCE